MPTTQLDYQPLSHAGTFSQGAKQLFGGAAQAMLITVFIYAGIAFGLSYVVSSLPLALLAALPLCGIALLYGVYKARDDSSLLAFAEKNNLDVLSRSTKPPVQAAVFDVGYRRGFVGGFATKDKTWLAGTYSFDVLNTKQTLYFSVFCIKLNGTVPHLFLDSKKYDANQALTKFDSGFKKGQLLQLEGNFGNYFQVYSVEGSQIASLSLLTPDVMAAFIDHGSAYSFELVDDYLVLVTNKITFDRSHIQGVLEGLHKPIAILKAQLDQNITRAATIHSAETTQQQPKLQRTSRYKGAILGVIILTCVVAIALYTRPN